jgi:hypothetical protein
MTTFPRACWTAIALALIAAPAAPQSKNAKKMQVRQAFVGVTTPSGAPVTTIAGSDFDVVEHGVKRNIVKAGLATNPMRIALMVDTSDAAAVSIANIRTGLVQFLNTLGPEHEVMLISTGRQMRVRVPATLDRRKLSEAANSLFGDGAGTPLMDALLEVDKRFMSKEDKDNHWPVFVILTSDGTESSAGAQEKEFNRWVDGLRSRAATVHAIVLKVRGNSDRAISTNGLPEVIAMNTVMNTGGIFDSVIVATALPDKMKTLAEQMNADYKAMQSRYQIDFETDTAGPLDDVSVGVMNHADVKLAVSYQRRSR